MKLLNRNKYESSAYWTQMIQLMIFDNVKHYLEETGLTRRAFAEKLGVSKGYVSQILNGDFDHKLSKLTELVLACDMVPRIELIPKKYASQVVKNTYLKPTDWKRCSMYVHTIPFVKFDSAAKKFSGIPVAGPIVETSSIKIGESDWMMDGSKESFNIPA